MDAASLERLKGLVATLPPLRALEVVESTGSTNADLGARAQAGEPEGLVLLAEHQTAGRGRGRRRWSDAPGKDLALSWLARPSCPASRYPTFLFHLGVAVAEALERRLGLRVLLKWPNDLVVLEDGVAKKLGGMLADSAPPAGDAPGWAVLGLGLNVGSEPGDWDPEFRDQTTSLLRAASTPVQRVDVIETILGALAACGPRLGLGGAPVAAWRARALWLNEPVTLNQGGAARRGILRGIAESGALLLEDDDGAIVPLHHGDLLRAAT